MKLGKRFSISLLIFILFDYNLLKASDNDLNIILDTAETFFRSLADRDFKKSWEILTSKSRTLIVNEIHNNFKANKIIYTHEQLNTDFQINGIIAKTYWGGFLKSFDPKIVLDECIWEKVLSKKNYAEIVIRYKKSEHPFHLRMYKEDGIWKVGLVETFWKK